ncbi:ATP-grasp domain-containing protein [Sabulicella rubraurantiaca]|uniref:ATP-grasp domain-containing protein n=1 Tax=Sabulicella rubraurantiaca TaxID=2811429 RepID=UPI001A962F73|nr:alpha-L-glutamate ligase [Sabulicella rubraurantiaca]
MSQIHVIHENPAWLPPLAEALDAQGLPWTEWFMHDKIFDLSAPPPEGVFYNRMSASSHTRDHRYSAELTVGVLAWLTRWGRKVVNGPAALDLEISKVRQYAALEAAGLRTPRTVMVAGRDGIVAAAREHFAGKPVILKPNRGGKGLGVQLFHTLEGLEDYVRSDRYEAPVDGIQLLQAYVRAPRPVITRAEFTGRRFTYAVEVDTSEGFELCPADVCAIGDQVCPVGEESGRPAHKFTVVEVPDRAFIAKLEAFLDGAGVDVAGIEFIVGPDGQKLVYDVNTNTNYNPEAEARAGIAGTQRSGMGALAAYLGGLLGETQVRAA